MVAGRSGRPTAVPSSAVMSARSRSGVDKGCAVDAVDASSVKNDSAVMPLCAVWKEARWFLILVRLRCASYSVPNEADAWWPLLCQEVRCLEPAGPTVAAAREKGMLRGPICGSGGRCGASPLV